MRLCATFVLGLVLTATSSCADRSDRARGGPVEQAALGGEVAARVGTDVIPVSLVAKVAADQHIAPREALRHLVDDAICANAARARGLDRRGPIAWRLTAARGRITADHIMAEARQAGPPTDAEIAGLTAAYWREVDRPVTVRVVHAVVRRPPQPDAQAEVRARAVAAEIRAAVLTAKDANEFQAKANAVPRQGTTVVAQPLPAFADDGYASEGDGQMDIAFTKGAFAIAQPGETSPVVESPFGWHVIRLVERIPEQRMPLEARRAAFTDEAYMRRARAITEARLKALRAAVPTQISPFSEQLMRSAVGPAEQGSPP